MAIKRPSDRNTKTEILSAFDALVSEKKALEEKLAAAKRPDASNGQTASVLDTAPKSVPASLTPSQPPNSQKIETIVAGLNQLQLGFGSAISDLSEKLTLETTKLQDLQQTIAAEVQQLEALHSLNATETSLEELIQQYETNSKTFNQELSQQRETVEQAILQAKKTWIKEQEEYRRNLKERNETVTKTQQRNIQEYNYDLALLRKLDSEEYEQAKTQRYQVLNEIERIQANQWAEREKTLANQEAQFAELKSKVEAMPKELEAAVKRAKEEGRGIANQQAKIKTDLLAKEVEGSKRTYELQIESLIETIDSQNSRIQALAKQLDSALKQVQDLAVKAIEGTANANSLLAVKEIAIEQAKNQSKNK